MTMSQSKTESLHFYKYLCQRIGSETVVRARRLTLLSKDLTNSRNFFQSITSGSMGEGLKLKGSDHDMMYISNCFAVYESDKDCVLNGKTVFVMDTNDTLPCFTHLRLYNNYATTPSIITQYIQQYRGENLLSNEIFFSNFGQPGQFLFGKQFTHIHGPCISYFAAGKYDFASCLKADRWIYQALPWISRSRSNWPSPELISKITSCGVLFVPIGNKGSINENLQWRMSFSVAEKMLIFSFSHTQLLCYALLKILLKEIVEKNEDIKGLLCSYFLKTLMFWISEETETLVWRPDKIIPCFMACLQRLLYCLEYSTLLHYFIPENNFFHLKFNSKNRDTLIGIFKNAYQIGVQIFLQSETLQDYRRFPCEKTPSVCEISSMMTSILKEDELTRLICEYILMVTSIQEEAKMPHMPLKNIPLTFDTLIHHCRTALSRYIFKTSIANEYQTIPFALPHINNTHNTMQYINYQCELNQLLVGVHSDAVSGWLKLAAFFYVHKNYLTSIDIINYTLSKSTDESFLSKLALNQILKLKLLPLLKTLPYPCVISKKLGSNSSGMPMELKSFSSIIGASLILRTPHNSISFAHFLHFLCCYHLQDFESCQDCINRLSEIKEIAETTIHSSHLLSLGTAFQMLGKKERARHYFHHAEQIEMNRLKKSYIFTDSIPNEYS